MKFFTYANLPFLVALVVAVQADNGVFINLRAVTSTFPNFPTTTASGSIAASSALLASGIETSARDSPTSTLATSAPASTSIVSTATASLATSAPASTSIVSTATASLAASASASTVIVSTESHASSSGLSTAAKAGISISVALVAVAVIAGIIFVILRRYKARQPQDHPPYYSEMDATHDKNHPYAPSQDYTKDKPKYMA